MAPKKKQQAKPRRKKGRAPRKAAVRPAVREAKVLTFPALSEEGLTRVPTVHRFPGTKDQRNAALLERAREAYENGTLDQEFFVIAAEYGVTPHEAYSAAFGYLPFVGGKAA